MPELIIVEGGDAVPERDPPAECFTSVWNRMVESVLDRWDQEWYAVAEAASQRKASP